LDYAPDHAVGVPFFGIRRAWNRLLEAGLRAITRFRGIGRFHDPMKYFGPGGLSEARRLCAAVHRDPAGYFLPDPDAPARNVKAVRRVDREKRVVEDLFFDSPAPSGRHRNDRVQLRLFRHHNTVGMKRVVFFHHPTYQDKWRLWEWFLAPLIAHVPVAFMTGPNHDGRVEPDDFPGEWTVNPNVHTLYRSIRQWCWDQQAAVNLLRERFGLEPAAISGFSVGAFQSILLAGLGGTDLPIVAIACTNRYAFGLLHGVIGPPVIKAMGRAGVTPAILEEMAESMQLERYAPALRGRNILMIRGLFDEVDPPPSLQRLEEALRPSRILRIPTGHGTLVFHRKAVMDETLLFLEELGILRAE